MKKNKVFLFLIPVFFLGIIFAGKTYFGGIKKVVSQTDFLRTQTAQASGVGSLKYVGYYWAFSSAYGDYLDEVAPYTNIISLLSNEPTAFAMAQRAKDKGMKIILDVSANFWAADNKTLAPNYQTLWAQSKPVIQQIVDLGNVYSFYMDEPMCTKKLADVETVINLMKTDFPSVKNMITENAYCQYPISGVDIYSVDAYDPPFNYPTTDIYNGLKSTFPGEIWVTAQAFLNQGNPPTVAMEDAWFNLAKSDPRYTGLYWFLYADTPDGGKGARSYPDVVAYNKQAGLQILCSNTWEDNPVCGADGVEYPNPDKAKCAGTTIANYGSCANSIPSKLGSVTPGWEIVGTGDFNGDGYSDILWRNTTSGQVYIWLVQNLTPISEVSPAPNFQDPTWEIKGVGDFNHDGKDDILWKNKNSGEVDIWFMDGTTIKDQGKLGIATPGWEIVGTGDFNGDGYSDILWRNTTSGQVYIWLVQNLTPISEVSPAPNFQDPTWEIKGVGDFNHDGKDDILWKNKNSGEVDIWFMDGTTIKDQGKLGIATPGWEIVGTGDFNGDGYSDILWRNTTSGQVYIWLVQNLTPLSEGSPGNVPVKFTGDFNHDGKSDILWTSSAVNIWFMDGLNRIAAGQTTNQCSTTSVPNGTVSAYPSCAITCNAGYTPSNNSCIVVSTPVNGVCSATHYNCSAGVLGTTADYPNSSAPTLYAWQWWCNGSNGGSNVLCSEAKPVNSSQFISQSVPASMTAGQSYPVSITFQNNGGTTWTAASSYNLGSQNPRDNSTWGLGRVGLNGVSIAPGTKKTFNFNVTAPASAGTYHFQWKMVEDGVAWFGDLTPNLQINVSPQSAPTSAPASTIQKNNIPVSTVAPGNISSGAAPLDFSQASLLQTINQLIVQLQSLIKQAKTQGITVSSSTLQFLATISSTTSNSTKLSFSFSFASNMGIGAANSDVAMLQHVLNALGFTVATTGLGSSGNEGTTFGPATQSALMRYQQSVGLPATGYLGPLTRAHLNSSSE